MTILKINSYTIPLNIFIKVYNLTKIDILGFQDEYNSQTLVERKIAKKDVLMTKELFHKIFSAFAEKSKNKEKLKALSKDELDKIFDLFDFAHDSNLNPRYNLN